MRARGLAIAGIAAFLIGSAAHPQETQEPLPHLDYRQGRFDLRVERVVDDVYVARRPSSVRYPVQGNAVFIVNATDVVVVDTGYPDFTENLVEEIRAITDRPVRYFINTHWHQDHNHGFHVLRRYWPEVEFLAHPDTRSELDRNNRQLAEVLGANPDAAILNADYRSRQLEEQRAAGAAEELLRWQADRLAATERYLQQNLAAAGVGELVVWLPLERVVVTGDLVVAPTPYGFGSRPREWIGILDRIAEMGFEHLIPGHGPVMDDTDYLDGLRLALRQIVAEAERATADGVTDVDEIRARIDLSAVRESFTGGDPLLDDRFVAWFAQPILEAALKELRSTDPE